MGPPVSLLNKQIEAGAEERWVVNIFILMEKICNQFYITY